MYRTYKYRVRQDAGSGYLSGLHVTVPRLLLRSAYVCPRLEKMSGKGVPQCVA